jgi:hypothetical protein
MDSLHVFLDYPELGPGLILGSILGPSGVSDTPTSSSSASFTGSPTPSPRKGGSPNTIAIAGVVIGSIAAISTVVASVFFYRRRPSQETPAIHATAATSQPQLPLSDERTFAPSPLSRPPIKMRLYVRELVPRDALVCPHVAALFPIPYGTHRTRITLLRSRSTGTTVIRSRWTSLLK